MKLHMQ